MGGVRLGAALSLAVTTAACSILFDDDSLTENAGGHAGSGTGGASGASGASGGWATGGASGAGGGSGTGGSSGVGGSGKGGSSGVGGSGTGGGCGSEMPETSCLDGCDNDGDSFVDCDDFDCACCLTNADCATGEFCRSPIGLCAGGTCAVVPSQCPAVYAPVCGCDDVTYSSECEARAALQSVAKDGPC